MFALYKPQPPPPPTPTAAAPTPMASDELQELLLAWEDEQLAALDEKAKILEKALAKVNVDLHTERAKVEATQKSTSTRWQLTPPTLSTPLALIRC
jgi:hypothetical protein